MTPPPPFLRYASSRKSKMILVPRKDSQQANPQILWILKEVVG